MLIVKILASLAFAGSVIWLIAQPDYEPAIAVVTSLSALIGCLLAERHAKRRVQEQTVGPGGVGVQAGGNITMGSARAGNTEQGDVR